MNRSTCDSGVGGATHAVIGAMVPTAIRVPTRASGDGGTVRIHLAGAGRQRRLHLLGGARAMAPWLLGVAPFGLVIGVSAAQADIPAMAGWLTGPLIFGGSAQVATIELLDRGAAAAVVIVAALAINLRLVLYSATMARHWQGAPRWWQAVAAALLIDPSLSVGVTGYEAAATRSEGHLHYMGGAVVLLGTWVAAITVGATVGTALPEALQLELVIPLFLVGDVVPRLTTRATSHAVAVAVALGAVGTWVPLHVGTLLAMAGGLAVALVEDRRHSPLASAGTDAGGLAP